MIFKLWRLTLTAQTTQTIKDPHSNNQVTVTFENEEKQNKNRLKKRFDSFGKKSSDSDYDFADLLLTLSHTEIKVLALLIKNRDYKTNIAVLSRSSLSEKESRCLDRAYKGLAKNEVVQRIRDETYLLNPKIFISTPQEERKIWEAWQSAKKA